MKKFWCAFFVFWPCVAIFACLIAPSMGWWFPLENGSMEAGTPLGQQIDDLFHLILIITTITFVGVQIALGYVLFRGARDSETDGKAMFTHGSHNLEVIWTIVPAGILLFIALYQMEVWAKYRVTATFPAEARNAPIAEVTARQFEWRIRYPAPGTTLGIDPQPGDLYTVNDLHIPTGRPVMINLRSGDVQHAFFAPKLRIKQDAVPGLVIPVWFEVPQGGEYTLLCAELCGWGHYKMKARIVAEPETVFEKYLHDLKLDQDDDGVSDKADEHNKDSE